MIDHISTDPMLSYIVIKALIWVLGIFAAIISTVVGIFIIMMKKMFSDMVSSIKELCSNLRELNEKVDGMHGDFIELRTEHDIYTKSNKQSCK